MAETSDGAEGARFNEGGATAADFLAEFTADWRPDWRVNVCGIWPDNEKPLEGQCLPVSVIRGDRAALARMIAGWNRRGAGVYFCPNPIRPGATMKRAKDENVAAVVTLFADIDPDVKKHGAYEAARNALWRDVEVIRMAGPDTTWILDTGNGAGLFICLEAPADVSAGRDACWEWQRHMRACVTGATVDSTYEPSRLMRLPGLLNRPKKSKRERGYPAEGRWAAVRDSAFDVVMPEAKFVALAAAGKGRGGGGSGTGGVSLFRADPATCPEDLRAAVMCCPNAGDRPGWVRMGEAIKAAASGIMDEADARELWHRWSEKHQPETDNDIARAWRSFRPAHLGWRHIEAMARTAGWDGPIRDFDDLPPGALAPATLLPVTAAGGGRAKALEEMNVNHVFILQGLRPVIARRELDRDGRAFWDFTTESGLRALYQPIPMPGGGCRVKAWMSWPRRRNARGVTLAPGDREITKHGYLNEWAGFAVTPDAEASCEMFRRHLLEVVCGGDGGHFAHLWRYLAHMVQRTAEKPGVAVVLRGQKGTGKTIVGDYLARIFGQHAVKLEKCEQITGRFTAHLGKAILVQVEEAVWAGDKAGEGALKHLITSPDMMIERKGIDATAMPNFARLLFTSNEGWVVPASADERRFFVLDVSPGRIGDRAYFEALAAEMEGAGPAALLHALHSEDLTGFDVRTAPRTAALRDQIERSEKPVVAWWRECLARGHIGAVPFAEPPEWREVVPKEHLSESFRGFWRAHNFGSHILQPNLLARDLKDWLPGGALTDGPRLRTGGGGRETTYRLPPLDECRRAFEAKLGGPCEWN